MDWLWNAYTGGRDVDFEPCAAPLHAESLADLPPAFVVLGGCDFLRDGGRLYAARLRAAGVDAYERIGTWVRAVFTRTGDPAP